MSNCILGVVEENGTVNEVTEIHNFLWSQHNEHGSFIWYADNLEQTMSRHAMLRVFVDENPWKIFYPHYTLQTRGPVKITDVAVIHGRKDELPAMKVDFVVGSTL